MVVRNAVLTRVDLAQRLVWRALGSLDIFTQQYLYDPFASTGDAQDAGADGVGFLTTGEAEGNPFPVEAVTRPAPPPR
jgi:hypothetical protein